MFSGCFKNYTVCKLCGEKVLWAKAPRHEEDFHRQSAYVWRPLDLETREIHTCKDGVEVKIYSEEEKKEFERKRLAGEI